MIGKINKEAKTPTIEFNITLDKVAEGTLPEKVLAEYTGNYDIQHKGTYYEGILNNFLGGPYEKVTMTVKNEGSLLYFTFPAAPQAELFWKAKDHFDASAFYDTELFFGRNTAGKVNEVIFKFRNGKEMKGTKV